jgi:hypothetical protein
MKLLLAIVALAVFTAPSSAPAQGTTYFSNVSCPTTSYVDIGSDAWGAAWFQTGSAPGGYTLDSIQLLMGDTIGSASGFSIMLWDFRTDQPILTLAGPSPSVAGTYTFDAAGFVLAPKTVYWFAAASQTPSAAGHFSWASTSQEVLGTPWTGGGFQVSSDGVDWTREASREFLFAVNAQVIPEPSASTMLILGSVLILALRRVCAESRCT